MTSPAEEQFLDRALAFASVRTVGILTIGEKQSDSLGTATLVKLGEEIGLLTCAHVVKKLDRLSEVGLSYFGIRELEKQFTRLDVKKLRLVRIGHPKLKLTDPILVLLGYHLKFRVFYQPS